MLLKEFGGIIGFLGKICNVCLLRIVSIRERPYSCEDSRKDAELVRNSP